MRFGVILLSLFFMFLVLFTSVHALPFMADAYIGDVQFPRSISNSSLQGAVIVYFNSGSGFSDGTVVVDLVATNNTYLSSYGTQQEWIVAEQRITGIHGLSSKVAIPFDMVVPFFAPPGQYRLDVYVKNGRQYVGGLVSIMTAPASFMLNVTRNAAPKAVPVINITATRAEDLAGTLGPFVNKSSVELTIVLTDTSAPVNVTLTACRWDDTATVEGKPDTSCYSRQYSGSSSPLAVQFPLPKPGSYGIRVEQYADGEVTSTSRLRAVRNGTSPRILNLELLQRNGTLLAQSVLGVSADSSKSPALHYTLVVRSHDSVMVNSTVVYQDSAGTVSFNTTLPSSSWYRLEGAISLANGTILDSYARTYDFCSRQLWCC